jgi:carbon-monoxide dehydrogenase medium subunit
MKPSKFEHYEPTSVDQAVMMLADVADLDGRVLAGGQTLVPAMALRLARPAYLVDINRIEELQRADIRDGALEIGACVRHAAFHKPVVPGPLGKLLATVVRHIAHLPIRTRGTFCGSIANADPASEWCLVSTTLDAQFVVRSVGQERRIPAREFFLGFMTTVLLPAELLVATRLPLLPVETRFGFEEYSRRAGDFAQAMALAVFEMHGGVMRNVRVGVGGVEDKTRRLGAAEACLEGIAPDGREFQRAADAAAAQVQPSDSGADEQEYRRQLVSTVVRRALEKAAVCAAVDIA